jgi:predicted MFS family arabinose efflux permease
MLTGAVAANLVMSIAWKSKKKEEPQSRTPATATTLDHSPTSGQVGQSEISEPSEEDAPSNSRTDVAFLLTALTLSSMTWVTLFTFFPPFSQSVGISILLLGSIGLAATGGRFLTYLLITKKSLRRRILDPEKRNRRILLFLTLLSASSLLFLIPDHLVPLYFVSFAIAGVVDAAVSSIAQVGVIAEAAASRAGAAAGLFESSTGIASFVGPIIAGAISGSSLVIPLVFPAAGMAVVLLAFGAVAALGRRRTR